jgi:hypothetical protein
VSHHVFCYPNICVALAIVHLEDQANKVGKNCRSSRLCLDRRHTFTSLWPDYGQTTVLLLGGGFSDDRRGVFIGRTGQCEGLFKMLSASDHQVCAFCRPHLSRLNAQTMRQRVSLHFTSSIYT